MDSVGRAVGLAAIVFVSALAAMRVAAMLERRRVAKAAAEQAASQEQDAIA